MASDQTRNAILAAAERLYADRGFGDVTLRDIVAEANVNLAAVNYHFGSKDELIAELFVTRSLAVLVALVLILMTLDLLGESGKILAVPGNSDADLWRYVGLRMPILFSRFLPFSVLLGTLIAFVWLTQNTEVVAMKAAGLYAQQFHRRIA